MQTSMFKKQPKDYGGSLRNTRKGRVGPRPISTKHTMHLVLKSTKARGEWNFLRPRHKKNIRRIIEKFAFIYGVKLISLANASNHLHLQIKLSNRFAYKPFIRAVTGAIAISVTGHTRQKKATEPKAEAVLGEVQQHTRPATNPQLGQTSKTALEASENPRASKKFWDHRPFTRVAESYKAYLILKDYIRMNVIEAKGFRRVAARSMVQVEKQFYGSS